MFLYYIINYECYIFSDVYETQRCSSISFEQKGNSKSYDISEYCHIHTLQEDLGLLYVPCSRTCCLGEEGIEPSTFWFVDNLSISWSIATFPLQFLYTHTHTYSYSSLVQFGVKFPLFGSESPPLWAKEGDFGSGEIERVVSKCPWPRNLTPNCTRVHLLLLIESRLI